MISNNDSGNEKFDYSEYTRNLEIKYGIEHSRLIEILADAENSKKAVTKTIDLVSGSYEVSKRGCGPLKTIYGNFYQMRFDVNDQWKTYYVIAKSSLDRKLMSVVFDKDKDVFLRIDSGCSTGQLFHDQTCECREQLDLSMSKMGERTQGLIIHIPPQDGRGKGIDFKLATLYLQNELKINTVDAFKLLEKNNRHTDLDSRTYDGAVAILKYLGVDNRLIFCTNNPKKLEAIKKNGFRVKNESIAIPPTEDTAHHLIAKQKDLGHNYGGM